MALTRQKNIATYIHFPLVDGTGTLVSGATGVVEEIETFDDGTAPNGWAACNNTATEIASSGWYYLLLDQSEMNFDYISIKITSNEAKPQGIQIDTIIGDPLNIATTASGALVWSVTARTTTGGTIDTVTTTTTATNVTNVNDKTGYSISGTINTLDDLDTALDSAHGAGVWLTATGFSVHSAADVWSVGTRDITGGTVDTATSVTNDVGITQAGADKVWSTVTRTITGGTVDTATNVTNVGDKTGYSISGTITTLDALVTDLESNHGATSWVTATGFSTHTAAAVWSVGTRDITGGTVDTATSVTNDVGITQAGADKVWGTVSRTITGGTITTVSDKTGYSITGTITTLDGLNNFDNTSDQVIVTTNNDKTGYSISGTITTFDALDTALDVAHGAGSWLTGGGGSGISIQTIPAIPKNIDLANTKLVRIALYVNDQSDDLPTTGEITAGTIKIDRSADGGTSWSIIRNDVACSKHAGAIYYDETFSSGNGYASADMIRITFKGQIVTISANDFEITDGTDGMVFITRMDSGLTAGGGATPQEIWEYATGGGRTLSTPADYKADVSNLDQAISTTESNIRGGTETLESLNTAIGGLNNLSSSDVQTVLETNRLDELVYVTAGAVDPTIGSFFDLIMNKDGSQTFSQADDSLEAIRDNQSAGAGDWTSGEKEQFRSALGIDGTKTTATGGQLQTITAKLPSGTISDFDESSNDVNISGTLATLDALLTQLATDHGAGDWTSATGFSTHSAANVWGVGTKEITGGVLTTPNDYKADVSGLATESNATTNTSSIITEVDANETKIDSIISDTDRLRYDGSVWIDDTSGNTGTVLGDDGTRENPVDNLPDALIIATALNVQKLTLMNNSSISLSQSFADWEIKGFGHKNIITLNSQSVDNARIINCTVTGTQGGSDCVLLERCYLNSIADLYPCAIECRIIGNITIVAATDIHFIQCSSAVPGNNTPKITFSAGTTAVSIRHYSGGWEIRAMTADHVMSLESDGQVIINADCTGGALTRRGMQSITDNSGGAVTITEIAAIDRSVFAPPNEYDTELDANVSTRAVSNEYDTVITNLQNDVTAIKGKTDNLPVDSEALMNDIAGLLGKNQYIDNYSFDGSKQMLTCRIRLYDSKPNAQAHGATGLLSTFTATSIWDVNDLESYEVVKD